MLNLIDACYHDFYKSLKSADGIPNVDPNINIAVFCSYKNVFFSI